MPTTVIEGHDISVDDEGFLTEYDQWDPSIACALATAIGVDLTDEHWKVINFLREDFKVNGATPTLRRVSTAGGIDTKSLFALFPKKPQRKCPTLPVYRSQLAAYERHDCSFIWERRRFGQKISDYLLKRLTRYGLPGIHFG